MNYGMHLQNKLRIHKFKYAHHEYTNWSTHKQAKVCIYKLKHGCQTRQGTRRSKRTGQRKKTSPPPSGGAPRLEILSSTVSSNPNRRSKGSVTVRIVSTEGSTLLLVTPVSVNCNGFFPNGASGTIASRKYPTARELGHSWLLHFSSAIKSICQVQSLSPSSAVWLSDSIVHSALWSQHSSMQVNQAISQLVHTISLHPQHVF